MSDLVVDVENLDFKDMGQKLSKPMVRTVAEAILEQLTLWGVQRIYGVVGDAIFGLVDAIAKQDKIQFIAVKHESVAAMMASAEAKCTGGLGVCVAQMGPGLANLINGLGDAYLDGFPVLAITGDAPVNQIGTLYKQYLNQQELVQAITGYSQLAVHPDAVLNLLNQAIHTSITANTVSHISIPADLYTMKTLVRPYKTIQLSNSAPDPGQLQQPLHTMRRAVRPMILLGNRARSATMEIRQLAEVWGSGIAMAYGAVSLIADSYFYRLGGLGEGGNPYLGDLFKQADVVLAIGTSWWPEGLTPTNASIIHVENHIMKPVTGIPADYRLVGHLATMVTQLRSGLTPHEINPGWVHQIRECKQIWTNQNEQEGNETGFPLHPSRIVRALEKAVTPETIMTLDEGDSTLWFMRNFRVECKQVLLSNRWRTMGFGLPAAMAAKLCRPHQQVLCLTGDGGLAMVLADLLTAARYRLNILVVVLNNGALQMEYNKMADKGFIPVGTELTNPDYVRLAEACGWKAYRIQSADELERLLTQAGQAQGPVLLDVPTARAAYPNYAKS